VYVLELEGMQELLVDVDDDGMEEGGRREEGFVGRGDAQQGWSGVKGRLLRLRIVYLWLKRSVRLACTAWLS
jgi:hypothetical protein